MHADSATEPMRILAMSGSLRSRSYNTGLLRAAARVAPPGMDIEIFQLADIPMFDADLEQNHGFPPRVKVLRDQIAQCDAILISSPEYNYSVPAALKNAIDWASRPPDQPMNGKPLGITGVSRGLFGTVRMQAHLRQIAAGVNLLTMGKPEMFVPNAQGSFDERGDLVDEGVLQKLNEFLNALEKWVTRLRSGVLVDGAETVGTP